MSEQDSQERVHDLLLQEDFPTESVTPVRTEPVAKPTVPPTVRTPSLSEVYEQAGVRVPAHGFSIFKIADMLGSLHIRDLTPDVKRAAILLALEASNIQLNEVIEDAARRERVLNEFETRQQQIFQNYKAGKQQRNQEIQAEVERLMERLRSLLQANEQELASEKSRLDEWRTRKREEERKIRTAASLLGTTLPQQPASDTIPVPAVPRPDAPTAAASAGNRSPAAMPAPNNSAVKPAARPSLWKR